LFLVFKLDAVSTRHQKCHSINIIPVTQIWK